MKETLNPKSTASISLRNANCIPIKAKLAAKCQSGQTLVRRAIFGQGHGLSHCCQHTVPLGQHCSALLHPYCVLAVPTFVPEAKCF